MMQDTEVCGKVFAAGTVLSVPSYTIHHLESVWGDPYVYRPERWLEDGAKELEKCLNIFSVGPRSCVGRNVAMMELLIFISTLIYRCVPPLAAHSSRCSDTISNSRTLRARSSTLPRASCANPSDASSASSDARPSLLVKYVNCTAHALLDDHQK